MPDNIIRVGTEVDLAGLASGIPNAASMVEQGANRMVDSFGRVQQTSQAASRSVLVDWAGRPFQGAADSAEVMRQTVDLSAESIKALSEAMKAAKQQSHETANGWEGFAGKVKEWIEHPLEMAADGAKKLLTTMGPIGSVLVGVAAGATLLGHEIFELVNEEGAAARQTQNFATQLGLGFEEAKKLAEMARLVDTDVGGLVRVSLRLADALEHGGKEADALKKIGVTATEAGPALLQTLEKLSQIENTSERMAAASEVLGKRQAMHLLPLIADYEKLSQTIEALGGNTASRASLEAQLAALEKQKEIEDSRKEGFKRSEEYDKAITDGYAQSAKRWQEANAKTLEGMKQALEKAKEQIKDSTAKLAQPIDPAERAKQTEALAKARADEARLELSVKAAEKAKSGADVAERNAIAEKQVENEKKLALNRILKAEQEMHAHVKALNERMTAEMGQINEQEEMAHAARVYQFNKEKIEQEFQLKKITIQEKMRLLKELEKQEYATQMASAQAGLERAEATGKPEEIAKAQNKIQQIADQYAIAMAKIKAETEKVTVSGRQVATSYMNDISGAFQKGFGQWLENHKKFTTAMIQSFREMGDQFIMNLIKMQMQRLVFDAINKTSAEKNALIEAKGTAVSAFHSVMKALPFPANVIVAPLTAAAMFTGAMSVGSFDIGGVVPKTGMKLIHEGERVLTERQNTTFERLVDRGGDGGNHYHAAPGESPDSVARNAAQFQRWMRDGRLRFA